MDGTRDPDVAVGCRGANRWRKGHVLGSGFDVLGLWFTVFALSLWPLRGFGGSDALYHFAGRNFGENFRNGGRKRNENKKTAEKWNKESVIRRQSEKKK